MDRRPDDLLVLETLIQNNLCFHEPVDIVIRGDGTVEVWPVEGESLKLAGECDYLLVAVPPTGPAGLDYVDEDSPVYHYILGFRDGLRKAGVLPPADAPTFSPGDTP